MATWRKTVAINNTVDLIMGEDGSQLYLSSRSKNQFFDRRELPLEGKKSNQYFMFLIFIGLIVCCWGENIWSTAARFSFGSGEWRDGAESCLNLVSATVGMCYGFLCPCIHVIKFIASVLNMFWIKEGDEITQDSSFTRWFSFNAKDDTCIILEKKGLPEHLQQLDNLETAVTLSSILTDMQDVGEALKGGRRHQGVSPFINVRNFKLWQPSKIKSLW